MAGPSAPNNTNATTGIIDSRLAPDDATPSAPRTEANRTEPPFGNEQFRRGGNNAAKVVGSTPSNRPLDGAFATAAPVSGQVGDLDPQVLAQFRVRIADLRADILRNYAKENIKFGNEQQLADKLAEARDKLTAMMTEVRAELTNAQGPRAAELQELWTATVYKLSSVTLEETDHRNDSATLMRKYKVPYELTRNSGSPPKDSYRLAEFLAVDEDTRGRIDALETKTRPEFLHTAFIMGRTAWGNTYDISETPLVPQVLETLGNYRDEVAEQLQGAPDLFRRTILAEYNSNLAQLETRAQATIARPWWFDKHVDLPRYDTQWAQKVRSLRLE